MTRLLIFVFLLIGYCAAAQQGTVKGKVTDAETGEPIIGANILVRGDGGAVTDLDGNYEIKSYEKINMTVSAIGYATQEFRLEVTENEVITLDITLKEVETLLNTVTVTSGRFEKPLSEVTVALEVLKPTLLESNNTVDVSTVLTKVPGVNIIDGQANIRGGSGYSYGAGSRVLLLVDDIPILNADAGFPNWRDIPVENIEQIEVVKGAASALYGSAALNGIINIRTAYAKDKAETKIATFAEVFMKPEDRDQAWWDTPPHQFGGSVAHRQKSGKLDLVVGGLYSNTSGLVKDEDPEAAEDHSFRRYGRFNANLRYRATERLNFGIATNINRGSSKDFFFWKGIDDLFIGDVSTKTEGTQNRFNIDPSITYFDKSGNRLKYLGRIYSVTNEFNNDQSNGSLLTYSELQYQKRWEDIDLVVTAGGVLSTASTEAELYGGNRYISRNIGTYAQIDKKFGKRLNISSGVRLEQNQLENETFTDSFSGQEIAAGTDRESQPVFRLGANYKAAEFTFLRASWGQGYRFPTIAEKYLSTTIVGGIQGVPNPDLQSETGWSAEVAVKQGFKISDFKGFVDFSLFRSDYQDMMEFNLAFNPATFMFGFQSRNVGETQIQGIELTVAGQGDLFGFPTTLLTGYNYIDPRFKSFDVTGKELSLNDLETATQGQVNASNSSADFNILKYRFQHSFTFDMETIFNQLSIGLAANYNSHMDAIDNLIAFDDRIIPDADLFRTENDNGFLLLNLRAAYRFTPQLKFSVLLNNALNETYAVRVGVMNAPRSVSARLDISL